MKKELGFGVPKQSLTIEEYFAQINTRAECYEEKSAHYRNEDTFICIAKAVSLALIAVLAIAGEKTGIAFVIAGLSGWNSILEVWSGNRKCRQKKLLYRSTCEELRREQRLYATSAGEYSKLEKGEKDKIFVERCEWILAREGKQWGSWYARDKEKQ